MAAVFDPSDPNEHTPDLPPTQHLPPVPRLGAVASRSPQGRRPLIGIPSSVDDGQEDDVMVADFNSMLDVLASKYHRLVMQNADLRAGICPSATTAPAVKPHHRGSLDATESLSSAIGGAKAQQTAKEPWIDSRLCQGSSSLPDSSLPVDDIAEVSDCPFSSAVLHPHLQRLLVVGKRASGNSIGLSRNLREKFQMLIVAATSSDEQGVSSRFICRPDFLGRSIFDTISVFVVLFDSVMLPYMIAWDVPRASAVGSLSWFTLCFWSTDMILNFFTGYYVDGDVEMRFSKIAKTYLQGWFTIDFFVNGCDWGGVIIEAVLSLNADHGDVTQQINKVSKLARLLRLAGVFRIARIFGRFRKLGASALSPRTGIGIQAVKLLAIIIWINHIWCCVWFGIGNLQGDTDQTWLDVTINIDGENESTQYRDAAFAYQYSTAYHWAITQMTPGSMQVFPVNSLERFFNVFCLIFGLLFGTSLVSRLSAMMVQYNMSKQEETKKRSALRDYLLQNQITTSLSSEVQQQVMARMHARTRLMEKDVVVLNLLSSALRAAVREQAFKPHFTQHPLFSVWAQLEPRATLDLGTLSSIEYVCIAPGDELFTSYTKSEKAYSVMSGKLLFHPERASSSMPVLKRISELEEEKDNHSVDNEVNAGTWLCEVVLWLEWTHRGSLEAVAACELLSVHGPGIISVLQKRPSLKQFTWDYCTALIENIRSGLIALDYLDVQMELGVVVMAMAEESRAMVAQVALHQLASQLGWSSSFLKKGFADLEQELAAGKCVLFQYGTGALVRTVLVTALRISRAIDNRIFVQVATHAGKNDDSNGEPSKLAWYPSVTLPGTKTKVGESPMDAAAKLLSSELAPVAEAVVLGGMHQQILMKNSESYGVKTKYIRTVISATMEHLQAANISKRLSGEGSVQCDGFSFGNMEPFVLNDSKGKSFIYAWLRPHHFAFLQAGETEKVDALKRWLSRCPLPVDSRPSRTSWVPAWLDVATSGRHQRRPSDS